MRRTLDITDKTGRVTLELSNSSSEFWDELRQHGLNHENYKNQPELVGILLIHLVNKWHTSANLDYGTVVDLQKSFYLVLSWNKTGWYQLFQFPIKLPDPDNLTWNFPVRKKLVTSYQVDDFKAMILHGNDTTCTLFEWYGESGGQQKYYPTIDNAIWSSPRFQLETLPKNDSGYGILAKAAACFPQLWSEILTE